MVVVVGPGLIGYWGITSDPPSFLPESVELPPLSLSSLLCPSQGGAGYAMRVVEIRIGVEKENRVL